MAASCFGQEAKILIVDKSDSTRLADAYREYKASQKKWEALKKEVAAKYVPVEPKVDAKGKQIGNETVIEAGWENPQFSGDFRAIVPANSQYASRGCTMGYLTPNYWWGVNPSTPVSLTSSSIIGQTGANTFTAGDLSTNLSPGTAAVAPDFIVGNNTVVNDDLIENIKTVERRPR
jgi:hypothetical protein